MFRRRWGFVAPLTLACVLPACGGGEAHQRPPSFMQPAAPAEPKKPQPVRARGSDEVTATVGRLGGTLTLAMGAELHIPEGALSEETEVTFSRAAGTDAFKYQPNAKTIGPSLSVAPALVAAPGARLRISIPFHTMPNGFEDRDLALAAEEIDDQQHVVATEAVRTRWTNWPATREGNRLSAELGGLPGMRLQFIAAK